MMQYFRGTQEEDNYETVAALSTVLKEVAEGNVPLGVAFMLIMGKLTAINKCEESENAARIKRGLDPLIRPVNSNNRRAKGGAVYNDGHGVGGGDE